VRPMASCHRIRLSLPGSARSAWRKSIFSDCAAPGALGRIRRVNQAIVAIRRVRNERRLITRSGNSVEINRGRVHRCCSSEAPEAESPSFAACSRSNRTDYPPRSTSPAFGLRRILAHHDSERAVCVHVIRPGLRIVFQNQYGRIVPERRVRNRFHYAADGQIIVGHRRFWGGSADLGAFRVVIGQPQLDVIGASCHCRLLDRVFHRSKCRRNTLARIWSGTRRLKSGDFGREVAHEFGLGCDIVGQSRNGPRPQVRPAAPLLGNRVAGLDGQATRTELHRLTWPRVSDRRPASVLSHRRQKIDEMYSGEVIDRFCRGAAKFVHKYPLAGSDTSGMFWRQRIAVGYHPFIVVGTLLAPIVLLPSLLEVIRADAGRSTRRGRRPTLPPSRRSYPARQTAAPAGVGWESLRLHTS